MNLLMGIAAIVLLMSASAVRVEHFWLGFIFSIVGGFLVGELTARANSAKGGF